MHSNLLLCRSHTPPRTSPLPSFLFYLSPPPPSSSFHSPPPASFYLHYSSSSELSLISPLPSLPLPTPTHPTYPLLSSPSTFHPPSIRQQTGNAAGSDWRFHCRTLTVSMFIIQVIAQVAAAHSCICIFIGNSELGHWQDFFFFYYYFWLKLSGHIRFADLSRKNTVEASVRVGTTLMWQGRNVFN